MVGMSVRERAINPRECERVRVRASPACSLVADFGAVAQLIRGGTKIILKEDREVYDTEE